MTNWLYGLDIERLHKELESYQWSAPDRHALEQYNLLDSSRRYGRQHALDQLTKERFQEAMERRAMQSNIAAADLEVAAELARREQEKLVEYKLQLVSEYTDDSFPNGQVIRFRKKFEEHGLDYLYAAIKVQNYWYVTGPRHGGKSLSWQSLILFLTGGSFPLAFENIEFLDTVNATPHAVVGLTSASPYEDENDKVLNVAAPYEPNEAWPIRSPLSNEDDDKTWQNRLAGAKGPDDDPDFDH